MANGRMHHHDKYAATKDGHRPDDPHGVTGWKQQEIDAQAVKARKAISKTERANTEAFDALTQRQANIQTVLDEPTIRREGHEPYSDESDYGQRVTAIGDITDDYEDQMDEELDPNNPYAKKAMFGQQFPDAWSTDSPDRFSVPASKVHGSIGRDQIMIDASSTGGGETDSHLLNFTTTESSVKELQKGKWRAEGTRNVAGPKKGQVHWQMYPEG